MEKMRMESIDLTQVNIEKIEALFPSVITEAKDETGKLKKAINFELLKQILSDEVLDGDEAYEFTWVGKKASIVEAGKPIRKTLRPCKEESKDWDTTENLYIEGDNLDVLKLLQESYLGAIKMIYIDPPYNTGKDFLYRDNFTIDRDEYDDAAGVYNDDDNRLFQNNSKNGRFHSDWCSMIYSRLKLARNLLTEDGVIFISIDENEVNNLRKICDEVYGETNFIGQITILSNPKGRSQDKYIANCHDYLVVYSKKMLPKNSLSISKSDGEIESEYTLKDSEGLYRELELRNTHREFGKHNRPNLYYPIFVSSEGRISFNDEMAVNTAVYPNWEDGFEGCWTWGLDKVKSDQNLLVAKIVKGNWKIFRKAYAFNDGERPLKQLKSIWTEKKYHTEKGQGKFNELFETKNKIFQSPKSVDLIIDCIKMSQVYDGYLLDFFSGSAATAHAALQLNAEDGGNRKWFNSLKNVQRKAKQQKLATIISVKSAKSVFVVPERKLMRS